MNAECKLAEEEPPSHANLDDPSVANTAAARRALVSEMGAAKAVKRQKHIMENRVSSEAMFSQEDFRQVNLASTPPHRVPHRIALQLNRAELRTARRASHYISDLISK
jgi:hypothetical protein